MMRLITIVGLVFLLSCCASTKKPDPQPVHKTVHSWRGDNVSDLMQVWGVPNGQLVKSKGRTTIYTYKTRSYVASGAKGSSVSMRYVPRNTIATSTVPNANGSWYGGEVTVDCEAIIVANANGIIVNTRVYGGHVCDNNNVFVKEETHNTNVLSSSR